MKRPTQSPAVNPNGKVREVLKRLPSKRTSLPRRQFNVFQNLSEMYNTLLDSDSTNYIRSILNRIKYSRHNLDRSMKYRWNEIVCFFNWKYLACFALLSNDIWTAVGCWFIFDVIKYKVRYKRWNIPSIPIRIDMTPPQSRVILLHCYDTGKMAGRKIEGRDGRFVC